MKTAQRTDVGRIRLLNEDRAIVQQISGGCTLAILADGMGGHQAGDIASQTAIEITHKQLQNINQRMPPEEYRALLRQAVETANEKVFAMAEQNQQYHGMGTTIVVALASSESIIIGHIGDSRAYLSTSREFIRLTEDHSLVNELLRSGQITPEEAVQHPRRNVLTRALGTEMQVEVDVRQYDWQPGDILLLCSDGLSSLLADRAIYDIMQSGNELEEKADMLIDNALEAGGDDNITVVLLSNDQPEAKMVGGRTPDDR